MLDTTASNTNLVHQAIASGLLHALRQWLEAVEVHDPKAAKFLCKLIPARCPFEQNLQLLGQTFHIPPLCKLNPLYNQLVGLRFRALVFLADECGEDVSGYCC